MMALNERNAKTFKISCKIDSFQSRMQISFTSSATSAQVVVMIAGGERGELAGVS